MGGTRLSERRQAMAAMQRSTRRRTLHFRRNYRAPIVPPELPMSMWLACFKGGLQRSYSVAFCILALALASSFRICSVTGLGYLVQPLRPISAGHVGGLDVWQQCHPLPLMLVAFENS